MAVSHIAVDLRLRNQCRYRVHDNDIHCPGAYHRLCNLEGLLAIVRLGDVQIINIHTDILRVHRVKCVLCVDKACNTAALLYFCHHVQCHSRLTTGLRSVDLNHTPLRDTA